MLKRLIFSACDFPASFLCALCVCVYHVYVGAYKTLVSNRSKTHTSFDHTVTIIKGERPADTVHSRSPPPPPQKKKKKKRKEKGKGKKRISKKQRSVDPVATTLVTRILVNIFRGVAKIFQMGVSGSRPVTEGSQTEGTHHIFHVDLHGASLDVTFLNG